MLKTFDITQRFVYILDKKYIPIILSNFVKNPTLKKLNILLTYVEKYLNKQIVKFLTNQIICINH